MVEQHHQLNGHAFEQTLGDGEGQGSMMCCSQYIHVYTHIHIYMCVYNLKSEYPNLILG